MQMTNKLKFPLEFSTQHEVVTEWTIALSSYIYKIHMKCCDWLLDRYAADHWLPFLVWAGSPRPQAGM